MAGNKNIKEERNLVSEIPSWLNTPPQSQVEPPVVTRKQELPLERLAWEDFEKLCLRLVRLEAEIEYCQFYGKPGQEQAGIDLYARPSVGAKYRVYQCKREKRFGPAKIRQAIDKFLKGQWAGKSDTFVLCTQESLASKQRVDELEKQKEILAKKGIDLFPWDGTELSTKLKEQPKLVDDFFGRAWVEEFCGRDAAKDLSGRLDSGQVIEFRREYATLYKHIFNTQDVGLPDDASSDAASLAIEDRFILPDIYSRRSVMYQSEWSNEAVVSASRETDDLNFGDNTAKQRAGERPRGTFSSTVFRQRQNIENWLLGNKKSVILGSPGAGKSTLLRFLAIDLLSDSPTLSRLAQQWGEFLPIWIPFGFWTKMIANSPGDVCPLSKVLESWLIHFGEQRLLPLVRQALEDERLLLLIDGLDEWADEKAAGIALGQLEVFVQRRDLPVVVTSRPHGFTRLGIQRTGWQIGKLSGFSIEQQTRLSHIWFQHRARVLSRGPAVNIDDETSGKRASNQTREFIDELHRTDQLKDLAEVPLLLCLLIYLKLNRTRLPQNRFLAYGQIVAHLISTHPQRRKTSALLMDSSSELTDEDAKDILAYLAYEIQERSGEGLIDQTEAAGLIQDYLADLNHGFGFDRARSRVYSRKMLDVAENALGLLVKRSPTDIGFFHNSFREYLAASYISVLPLKSQMEIIDKRCIDTQWHEVILSVLYLTRRPSEVKQFLDALRGKKCNLAERYMVDLLIYAVAFGDFKCPADYTKELAQKAFSYIEQGEWMPHRERLLNLALDGLQSTKTRELLIGRLCRWFPCRARWRRTIFEAMGNWGGTSEVIECLWRGLHDEDVHNRRAAAGALAKLKKGDKKIGDRLLSIVRNHPDHKTKAVAFEALLEGWLGLAEIDELIEIASSSPSPALRLVALTGKIKKGRQNESDIEEAVILGSWEYGAGYEWNDRVFFALLEGWPRSDKVKRACLKSLHRARPNQANLEKGVALQVLFAGFANDDYVVDFCVYEIDQERFPFLSVSEPWKMLATNFRGNPRIAQAVDNWLPKQEHNPMAISFASLVGRTATAKAKLISKLNSEWQMAFWYASALLEGWGMEDDEVRISLSKIAYGPIKQASVLGVLLPRIIQDDSEAYRRLIGILRSPECRRPDFVLQGLQLLRNSRDDEEIVFVALDRIRSGDIMYEHATRSHLISGFPSDERVRQLAFQELDSRKGAFDVIARSYGADKTLRKKIIDLACPLPKNLRNIIAERLGESSEGKDFVKLYDYEVDAEVKCQSAISYYSLLKKTGSDIDESLGKLSKDIVCYGQDFEERRQAAFCGLVTLRHLDLMLDLKERSGDNRPCAISLALMSPNVFLIKHILRHWNYIKSAFGEQFMQRFSRYDYDPKRLWDLLCVAADEFKSPRIEALRYLESDQDASTTNILRFLSRVKPGGVLLLNRCLAALPLGSSGEVEIAHGKDATTAAQIIGAHFEGEREVLNKLVENKKVEHASDETIIALCEGWWDSEELGRIFDHVKSSKRQLSLPAYSYLISRKSSTNIVFQAIKNILDSNYSNRHFSLSIIAEPLIRRIRSDDELTELLMEELEKGDNPASKVTVSRLLISARGLSERLKCWCIRELKQQLDAGTYSEVGFDLLSGELTGVHIALLANLTESE